MKTVWCVCSLVLSTLWAASPTSGQSGNPYEGDERAIRAGGAMYQARCAECHGPEAEGVMGPNLTRLWIDGATASLAA